MSLVLQNSLKFGSVGGGGSSGTTDYNALSNKPAIDGVTLLSSTKKSDLGLATVINDSSSSTLSITLADNNIYNNTNAGLTTLTVTNPSNLKSDFIAQINFTSGATPTIITPNGNIIYVGDNVNEAMGFVPRANCRYTILYMYDGNNLRGIVQGVSL